MIIKTFYDKEDYDVVLKLLNRYYVPPQDIERVKTRQLFMEGLK